MSRRRLAAILALLYLVALAASHAARRLSPESPLELPAGYEIRRLDVLDIAFRDLPGPASSSRPVVLLHGSPGSSADFSTLAPALARELRTLAPDLPGFGRSRGMPADYSIRAHAAAVLALLDDLGIEDSHFVGFSMGGGVALEIARQQPGRVASLTLLSSIGVQELELLGSYRLNRALHGLQLGALWVLHEATPHFGLLDGFPLNVEYARNFFDTDQRPLRRVLERLEAPTLVLHGARDILVPIAAAREHHRLVPHSELRVFEAGHFLLFRRGETLAAPILDFLRRVESGAAVRRQGATPDRVAAAAEPFDTGRLPRAHGLALLVLMALLALATLVSEDLASIGAGLLVAQGRLGFVAASLACFVGILVGDIAIYLGGRFLGRPWLDRAPVSWLVSRTALERSERWFAAKGPSILFASRFLPGTRVATYFASGLLGIGLWRFAGVLTLAVAFWAPLLVGAAALLGARVFELFESFAHLALPVLVALSVTGWLLLRLLRSLLTRRGRRLLVGQWRRLRHWEFWPPWLLYAPVAGRCLALAARHRGPTVFTAANPGMPAGGFVGESKAAILAALDPRFVARFTLLSAHRSVSERLRIALDFLATERVDYPVVLKPDVGQRGQGVAVVADELSLRRYLATARVDTLVQEHIAGPELGVFYARHPDDERGRIISITDKRLPTVTGDGVSTIEELVLADERAVAMAAAYFEHIGDRLDQIPARGEIVEIVAVGTHCRGAVFLDGKRLRTPALETTVDEMSRTYAGFFFGRYDLKAPSYDSFECGEGIKVLELNGVTSEVTHIYDPGNSLGDAWRALFTQWELAFEIGRANVERGVEPVPARDLLRLAWSHLRPRPRP